MASSSDQVESIGNPPFAQELLSTFSTSLGEVSLIPATGGVFAIDLIHAVSPSRGQQQEVRIARLWDRNSGGGFPGTCHISSRVALFGVGCWFAHILWHAKEVKQLKQLVRDIIDPDRDLGHVDRHQKEKPRSVTENEQFVKPDS
ncbi:MAG: hypothetical protein Q9217_000997 [Psora testacea]